MRGLSFAPSCMSLLKDLFLTLLQEVSDHHQGEVDPVVVAGVKDGWTTTMITKQQAQRDEETTTE